MAKLKQDGLGRAARSCISTSGDNSCSLKETKRNVLPLLDRGIQRINESNYEVRDILEPERVSMQINALATLEWDKFFHKLM